MRYRSLILLAAAVCGVTFWQFRLFRPAAAKNPGGREGASDTQIWYPKEAEQEIRRVESEYRAGVDRYNAFVGTVKAANVPNVSIGAVQAR